MVCMNLKDYLNNLEISEELVSVILSLFDAIKDISKAILETDVDKAGTENVYGESQLDIDVVSDNLIADHCKKNPLIGLIASEERPDEERLSDGEFAVCYDPLDGSSLIDVNLAVGSIFGIYEKESFIGVTGDDQVAAVASVYGPRTTVALTVGRGVVVFMLNSAGEFEIHKDNLQITEGKMFAPGNLRACAKREDYLDLVNFWCKEQYTLRYSGGMVPDVNQILLKGKGIFAYPAYEDAPEGKLRLLFECAPLALIMEQAGGAASSGKQRILSLNVEKINQRTPIFIGSKLEVERCKKMLA